MLAIQNSIMQLIHLIVMYRKDCMYCYFNTPYNGNLAQYIRTHMSERPYKCTQYEYRGVSSTVMQHHKITHKKDAKEIFQCTQCDFETHLKNSLFCHIKTHMVRNHINAHLPLQHNTSWQHMRTHTGETNPCRCPYERCEKTFSTPGNLKKAH